MGFIAAGIVAVLADSAELPERQLRQRNHNADEPGQDPLLTVPLAEQARLLELTHDTVIIRDKDDRILFWNGGAEALYGYSRAEAVGAYCSALLQCDFPSDEVKLAFQREGRWFGEMTKRQAARPGNRTGPRSSVSLSARCRETATCAPG